MPTTERKYQPPSANGFCLNYTNETGSHYLTAYWLAPFFVLLTCEEGEPLFVHCDDLEHARSCAKIGGMIFNAAFERFYN